MYQYGSEYGQICANMQDMWDKCRYARYVPIHADMDDTLQGMLTYIDMKKLAKNGRNIARYARYLLYIANLVCILHHIRKSGIILPSYRFYIYITWYVVTCPHITGWAIYRRIEFFFSTSNIQFSTQICHSALRYFTDSHNMQQISSQICISKFLHLRRHIGKKSICALDVIYLSLHLLRISLFILLIL